MSLGFDEMTSDFALVAVNEGFSKRFHRFIIAQVSICEPLFHIFDVNLFLEFDLKDRVAKLLNKLSQVSHAAFHLLLEVVSAI